MNKISKLWTRLSVAVCLTCRPTSLCSGNWPFQSAHMSLPGGFRREIVAWRQTGPRGAFYRVLFLNCWPFISFCHLVHNRRGYFEKYIYFVYENKSWKVHTFFLLLQTLIWFYRALLSGHVRMIENKTSGPVWLTEAVIISPVLRAIYIYMQYTYIWNIHIYETTLSWKHFP